MTDNEHQEPEHHCPTCDGLKRWEALAVDHLAGVVGAALYADAEAVDPDERAEVSAAVAAAVWAELTDTPVTSGEHPGRDLAVWYVVQTIGAHLIDSAGPVPPGALAAIPLHHLANYFNANLDSLQAANADPADIVGTGETPLS